MHHLINGSDFIQKMQRLNLSSYSHAQKVFRYNTYPQPIRKL